MDGPRYPINVRLIGVMHKEKSKLYMTSVLWSDHNDIVVYRGFEDFKKFHKQMKKAFPPANPLKKTDRMIPKFEDKKMKGPGKKGPNKSVVRLKVLEQYCAQLLRCGEMVSHSPELLRFFQPNDHDLQPEFSQNSIVIMPSEDSGGSPVGSPGGLSGDSETSPVGNVSQPFVTEAYRCIAPYETKDSKNQPFKVAVDESVDVLIKDKAGWWLVENDEKRMAWFPAPYLEKMDADDDDEDEYDGAESRGASVMYCATKSYKAAKRDEASVDMGSVVEVLLKSDNGWWLIRSKGKAGYVPSMYLKPYINPLVRLQNLKRPSMDPASLTPPGPSGDLSRSQGNLLQPCGPRPSPSGQSGPLSKSRSLTVLSMPDPREIAAAAAAAAATLPPPTLPSLTLPSPTLPSPTIVVEGVTHDDQRGRSPTADSELSQSSDSSFSDLSSASDLSSSLNLNLSSSLNLSRGFEDERLRLSRTPPPMVTDRLTPDGPGLAEQSRATPSRSTPNLSKAPATPKVPPRPQRQEILTRCTTVTRKKAARVLLTPAAAQVSSH